MSNSHKLYLGMYILKMKKKSKNKAAQVSVNDFLSEAYYDKKNHFSEGFAQALIHTIDTTFKTDNKTQGAIISGTPLIREQDRILDIMLDGGNTGIRQSVIDDNGQIDYITKDKIVGMKFFVRFWMPGGSENGYVFIQSYGTLGIKTVIDSLINKVLGSVGFTYYNNSKSLQKTTTKQRQKEFMNTCDVKYVTLVSSNTSSTTGLKTEQVEIKLKKLSGIFSSNINNSIFKRILKNQHNIDISSSSYKARVTYDKNGEIKTADYDPNSDITIIPNIEIPSDCIDLDNYPIQNKLAKFVDEEMLNL